MFHDDFLRRSFERLRHLQNLYCDGHFEWGSPEHSEILALEELESFWVREEMKRFHTAKLNMARRHTLKR